MYAALVTSLHSCIVHSRKFSVPHQHTCTGTNTDYRAPCVYTSCLVCNHRSNQQSIPANIAWTSARQRGGARWRVRIGGASDDQLSNARNPLHTFFRKFPVDGETANLLWTCCRLSRRLSYHIISYCTFLRRQFKNTGAAAIKRTSKFSAVLQILAMETVSGHECRLASCSRCVGQRRQMICHIVQFLSAEHITHVLFIRQKY